MTGVDTSRAPKGEFAARRLIEAVVASDDRVERHFLEVKSALDLTTKKDQAKLAKFILGAANRMPDQAGKAFEGYGVMVLGAAEGSAIGMPQIEALEIHKAVLPFIGADGPGYDLVRVPCTESDNEILVFLVDPPEWGQGPFICRKSGDGQLRDGAVFVRADGETREARADELRQLIQRGQAATTEVDFAVRVVGVVRPVKLDDERTLEEFISHHRCRLHAALNQAKSTPNLDVTTGDPATAIAQSVATLARQAHLSMHMFTEPESRDEDDYLASIDDWAVHVRAAWPEVVLRLIGAIADPVEVEVTNHEKTFFRDVELKVHLEGNVLGVACWESRDALDYEDLGMPSPPRAWGPKTSQLGNLGVNRGAYLPARLLSSVAAPALSRTSWQNSGSVDWEFSVDQLRPKGVDASDEGNLALYTDDASVNSVHGTWEITARDHHDVYSGSLEVEVRDPLDLTHALRLVLGLEGRDR